jgi:putative sterol carrier protein
LLLTYAAGRSYRHERAQRQRGERPAVAGVAGDRHDGRGPPLLDRVQQICCTPIDGPRAGGATREGDARMAHEFLSDDWIAAVEALNAEAPEPPAATKDVVINLVVTDSPFGERESHIAAGKFLSRLDEGASTTMTMPYDVAKKLFVDQDQAASMQAFMSGQITISGDMTQLMKLQTAGPPTAEQEAFQARIQDLTT